VTTIDQLLSWNPDALGTSAEGLNADRKALVDLQDEMDGGGPPVSWQGQAATAAGESHDRLYDRLADLVAAVSPVVGALDVAQAEISAAKESVLSAKSTIAGEGWVLEESGGSVRVSAPASATTETNFLGVVDEKVDEARMTMLAQQIADALQRAGDADAQLASVLDGARTGRYDAASGTLANAALPPELRGLSDQEIADYLVEHPDRDFDLESLSTEQQQLLGQTIADKYASYSDDQSWQPWMYEGEEPPSAEDIEGLNSLLAAYGDDSTVATALLDDLGPEGMLHVQQTMLAAAPTLQDDVDVVGESQRLWGQTLAAGTSGLDDGHSNNGSTGPAEHVSQAWLDGLVDAAGKGSMPVDSFEIDDTYSISMNGYAPSGYQLLGPLLRDDGHSSHFLNTIGDSMESYEKAFVAENGTSPWRGPMIDVRALDLTDGAPDDYLDLRDYDHATGYDPMGGLMEGLSHNPDAARDFLAGGDGDRVDYYMNEREWPHGEHTPYPDLPSEQRHFGDALVSATTVDPDARSPHLAEQAVDSAASAGGDLAPELKQPLGTMLGGYMPDVYSSLGGTDPVSTGDADPWLPGEQSADLQARFDEHQLRQVLSTLGTDDGASSTLSGAATQYAQYGYDHYFGGESDGSGTADQTDFDKWESRLEGAKANVNSPYAEVISALGEGATDQMVSDGLAADAANSAEGDGAYKVGGWVAEQLVDKGVGAIPFVGDIGADAINTGVTGPLTDHLAGLNDVDTTNEVRQHVGDLIADNHGTAAAMAQESIYSHLPVGELPEALVHDGDRIPMSQWDDEQRDAWTNYQSETGYGGLYSQLADDLEDELVGSTSQTEQESGE
jgi:hypothetical protein